jgi:16S rRNA (cytosine967-C5)-methyltransferase
MKPEQTKIIPTQSTKISVTPARRVAFNLLQRVASEQAYASVLITSETHLSAEDHGLAQEILLGVLRHQQTLDYFIEKYTKRKVEKLDLAVLLALRMGLYQLRYLTRIPQSAAVNEAVNLVKLARKMSAAPLVNATLRNAAKHLDDKAGETITDRFARMSVEVSHPQWMLERWIKAFGEAEARQLAIANNRTPAVAFRVNTLRAQSADVIGEFEKRGLKVNESKITRGAFIVESGSMLKLAETAQAGLVYIQDDASQLVALLLEAKAGQRILDLCAAPGSKTSHLAALTENQAEIIATDLHWHRLLTLIATCKRLGVSSVEAIALDATKELPFVDTIKPFDRVLLDAPCSGTGTLRRNPEIKWRLELEDIKRLAEIQAKLLERAASGLAVNARLVYSTCSLEREENEAVVYEFLESDKHFRLVKPQAPMDCITDEGFVRTFPHQHHTDGFFAAVLERVE